MLDFLSEHLLMSFILALVLTIVIILLFDAFFSKII